MIKKFTLKILLFFVLYSVVMFVTGFAMVELLEPASGAMAASFLLLLVSLLFMFVPQAIVIDEVGVLDGVRESVEFISKNPGAFFRVLAIGAILVAFVVLAEFALDFLVLGLLPGRFVSVFLMLVFVVPFLEVLKTYQYMLKFDLVKRSEFPHKRHC